MLETNREHWLSGRQAKSFFSFASLMIVVLFAVLCAPMAGILIAGEDSISTLCQSMVGANGRLHLSGCRRSLCHCLMDRDVQSLEVYK